MEIIEKKRQRAAKLKEATEVLEKALAEKRDLTDTEERRHKALVAEADRLSDEILALEERVSQQAISLGGGPLGEGRMVPFVGPWLDDPWQPHEDNKPRAISGQAGRSYRGMFGLQNRELDTGGFKDFREFLEVIHSGRFDPRLQQRAMVAGTPSLGGFSVPEQFGAWLLDASLETEVVRPRAQVWGMTSETRKIPAWDGSDHTSDLFGGFSGTWMAENSTATRQNARLRQLTLHSRKLGIYTQVSRELLLSGIDIQEQLGGALVKAVSWYLDYAFLRGTGAGQPLGVLNDPALIVVAKEAGQAADTLIYENVTKIFARMHPSFLRNAVWVANSTTVPQLLQMSMVIGTAGSHVPVLREESGRFSLLGKPVLFTEKLPSLGNQGDILLADFSQYAIGLRQGISLERSNAPGWLEDVDDFRAILLADGQGTLNEPITPKNGDTLSWCVTLAARA